MLLIYKSIYCVFFFETDSLNAYYRFLGAEYFVINHPVDSSESTGKRCFFLDY